MVVAISHPSIDDAERYILAAALARRKARGVTIHAIVRSNPDTRPEQSGSPFLSISRDTEEE